MNIKTPLLIVLLLVSLLGSLAAQSTWVDQYDALLKKYVQGSGVRYEAWKSNKNDLEALQSIVSEMASFDVRTGSKDDQLAFYLNAYNANILHQILESYPVKGPGGGGLLGRNKFFKSKSLVVAGQQTSFSLLENELIRPRFNEPRIHFALNCASTSCPPLADKVFRGATLDTELDRLTKAFLNGPGVMDSGKTVALSKIFQWYKQDFQSGDLLSYVNQYRSSKLDSSASISFQKYLWTLNTAK